MNNYSPFGPISIDPFAGLNPEQAECAAIVDGPVCAIAGAGTGKTTLFVARIINLKIKNRSNTILGLTFTKGAADEMRDRLVQKVGADMAASVTIGTFHSISARLLRTAPEVAGLTAGFNIIDENDAKALLKKVLLEAGYDKEALDRDELRAVHGTLQAIKDRGILPDGSVEHLLADPDIDHAALDVAAAIYPAYQQKLCADNVADFADLILWVVEAMKNDEALRLSWAKKWNFVQVDEYQDTSSLQDEWITLLAKDHRNLFVVGDDSQALYVWRGASPENILTFHERWPGTQRVDLVRNYRCTATILNAANAVIANNVNRLEKQLITGFDRDHEEPVRVAAVNNDWQAAKHIALAVALLREDETTTREQSIFVLYRVNFLSRVVEEAIVHAGLKYTIVGDLGFYGRQEIKDALAYIRLMENPADQDAFLRIANVPARGLGDKTVESILSAAESGQDIFEAARGIASAKIINKPARAGLAALEAAKTTWATVDAPLSERLARLLEDVGYWDHWRGHDDAKAEERIENLHELLRVTQECSKTSTETAVEQLMARAAAAEAANDPNATLRLMTIHGSKGQEADHVMVVGMTEGLTFPGRRTLEREAAGDLMAMEQERNLAYVAFTRARLTLTLFVDSVSPSRFALEIPDELVERLDGLPPTVKAYRYAKSLAESRGQDTPTSVRLSAHETNWFIEQLKAG